MKGYVEKELEHFFNSKEAQEKEWATNIVNGVYEASRILWELGVDLVQIRIKDCNKVELYEGGGKKAEMTLKPPKLKAISTDYGDVEVVL